MHTISSKSAALCLLFGLAFFRAPALTAQERPIDYLTPVATVSPRSTLNSFMEAMNAYRQALSQNAKKQAEDKLERAVRTLNLSTVSALLLREQKGKEAAIYLKETIDRIVVIDYTQVPDKAPALKDRWRLAGSAITISQVKSGDRAGEYLFSSDTVQRAYEFYRKVKHLPYLSGSGQGSGYRPSWIERNLPEWAKKPFLSLDWWQWGGLFLAILSGLVLRVIVRFSLLIFLRVSAKSPVFPKGILAFLESTVNPLGYLAAIGLWFLSLFILQLQGTPLALCTTLLKVSLSACLLWLSYKAADHLSQYFQKVAFRTESKLDDQLAPLLTRAIKILTLIAGGLLAIQNLGVNVASLLAGLGLGGLAFALAARDTVANLFGSLMIIFDRPFKIGDWIKVGDTEGTVEDIGFRSTRIRTFYNSVISIPNSEVANIQIDNLGVRSYRRAIAHLSLDYATPPEKMEAFLEGIKNIIKANPVTRKDYYHVVFKEYGDSGLIVMVYFFLKVKDWATELVERQNVYIEIYRLAKDLGVNFAFPTQSLHIESFPGKEGKPLLASSARELKEKKLRQIAKEYDKDGKRSKPKGLGIFSAPFRENKTE